MSNDLKLLINSKDYPMLNLVKKKNINKLLLDIFKTGYNIYFPNTNISSDSHIEEIKSGINILRAELAESDISDIGNNIVDQINEKIEPLNASLNKLLGLQTASSKKGELAENIIQNIFMTRYGDIQYEDKSHTPHSGDAWIVLPNNYKIMIESKNYLTTINKSEIEKMEYDMKFNNIRFCLFLSMNASVQNFRDMDFHTFTHNNETYFTIIVSNMANEISKLDLAFMMMRKIIELFNKPEQFPWIQKKIHDNLNKINEIINKNYILRDNFNDMEKIIYKSLDVYHKNLRDYQYDMEVVIKQLTHDINTTLVESIEKNETINDIFGIHKKKIIYPLLSKIGDMFEKKKWGVKENSENKYIIFYNNDEIGNIDIQLKKIIIKLSNNQTTLIFDNTNLQQNNSNLQIIDSNF